MMIKTIRKWKRELPLFLSFWDQGNLIKNTSSNPTQLTAMDAVLEQINDEDNDSSDPIPACE